MKRSPLKRGGKHRVKRAVWWLKDLFGYRDAVRREDDAAAREKVFGAKAKWIRKCVCVVPMFSQLPLDQQQRCGGKVEAAHAKSRGAGGDSRDLIPMCMRHHSESHTIGVRTFEERYSLNLEQMAAWYEEHWQLWASEESA